jgi:crotonobetainyl-CoA:carnitine CoA-transferase CaiB-like acyl-CoA transferase
MLSPYRVLDLTDERGILCGQMLADLGAEVIAVEPPTVGSPARRLGPFFRDQEGPEHSLFWWAFARGKLSVTLDLGQAEGVDLLRRLAASADVLIESEAPGRLDALGLGHEELARLNPGLVYVSVTPFGESGPRSGWAATDIVLWAAGGPLLLTGDDDRPPLRVSVPQAYHHAAADAAVGAVLALLERSRSGRGQRVAVSAQQSVAQATQSWILAAAIGESQIGRLAGGVKLGPLRLQLVWPAKDGHVAITLAFGSAIGPFTRRLMEVVWSEGLCDESLRDKDWESYATLLLSGAEPAEEYERIKAAIAAFAATKTKRELMDLALEKGLLIAPIANIAEVVESDQLRERRYWLDVEHPVAGTVRFPGAFARTTEAPIGVGRRAPFVGEHNGAVFGQIGLGPKDLARLRERGVI